MSFVSAFDFVLPPDLIAQHPADERSAGMPRPARPLVTMQ